MKQADILKDLGTVQMVTQTDKKHETLIVCENGIAFHSYGKFAAFRMHGDEWQLIDGVYNFSNTTMRSVCNITGAGNALTLRKWIKSGDIKIVNFDG